MLVWRRGRKSSGVNTAATTKMVQLTSESCSFSENSEKFAFLFCFVVNVMCAM